MARKAAPAPPVDDLDHTLERVALTDLRPHPRNYHQHPEEELAHLMQSLTTHGLYRNPVIARDGTILAGHGVVTAAQRVGYTHLSVKRMDLDPHEPRALQIVVGDNEIARLAISHEDQLATLLQELAQHDPLALLGTGFDEAALAALVAQQGLGNGTGDTDAGRDVEPQIDRAEELREQWGVEVGQLWACGAHRVICGDSTEKAVIQQLLMDSTPNILINDPQYGMRLDADFSTMTSKLRFARDKPAFGGHKYNNVLGDHVDFDAGAVVGLMTPVQEQFWFGADYYAGSLGDTQHTGAWLVWDKRLDETMDQVYGSCFELIWSRQRHKRLILRHKWAGIFGMEQEAHRSRLHPTQKPVVLIEDLLQRYSPEGALVADLFLGSGTTLIACENLKRTCYGCELDPGYVAVTLQRYFDLTGEQPQVIG